MEFALFLVTVAIAALAVAVALFVAVLAARRLGQRWAAGTGRRTRALYADLVRRVAIGGVTAVDAGLQLRPGSTPWLALEEALRAARHDAPPEGVRRIERFLAEAGFSDHYLDRLVHGDRYERATAAVRLAEHRNPRTVPALIVAVSDPDRDVRTAAVRALGYLGSPAAVEALAQVLARGIAAPGKADVAPRVVAGTLVRFGPQAVDTLAPLLAHPSWRVRGAAAYLVGELGASRAVPALILALADPEPDVRAKAAQALGRLEARSALFPLLGRLEDPAWLVRMHAIRALGALVEPTAAEPVGRRLRDAHWRVRQEAGAALARMGRRAQEVLTQTLLTADDPYAREQVVEELQRTPVLDEALDHLGGQVAESGEPQGPAGRLLAAVADTGAHSRLLAALDGGHPDPAVRVALTRLLGGREAPRVRTALARAADADPDPMVRREAALKLQAAGAGTDTG